MYGLGEPGNSMLLRDRAIIGVMVYSFARVGAVVGMNVEDYFQEGKRWWFRLHQKGGKRHEVPAHHCAEAYLEAAEGVPGSPWPASWDNE
jgi:integrase